MRPGVDEPVALDLERQRQEAARHVGDERRRAGRGELGEHGAKDGVVLADVHIVEVVPARPLAHGFKVGDAVEVRVLAGGEHLGLTVSARLLPGELGEIAREEVAGAPGAHEVERDAGELQGRAALEKEDAVVAGDAQQTAQARLGVVDDGLERGGAVAHLEYGHAAARVVEQLGLSLAQHALGERGRAGGEIVHTRHGAPSNRTDDVPRT